MKKVSILLLPALCFSACLKLGDDLPSNEFHITGRVLAYGTNEPVAGAIVRALECTGVDSFTDPCIFRTVATDTTDAEGRYEFDAKNALLVSATKDNYSSRNAEETVDGGSGERKIDIVIQPYAWLNITLTNKSDFPYVSYSTNSNYNAIIPKDSLYSYSYKVLGNDREKIYIKVSDISGKYKEIYDTIYCPGLDTTFHHITY